MKDRFFPALDDVDGGIITDPEQQIERIVAFIFANPGGTSVINEHLIPSLGSKYVEFKDTPQVLAAEYENLIQKEIDSAIGPMLYTVTVEVEKLSVREYRLILKVLNTVTGELVILKNRMVSTLTEK